MSRKGWGWWQQLQSGEYPKTKLKLATNGWLNLYIGKKTTASAKTDCPPDTKPASLEPSIKSVSSDYTNRTIPKHLPIGSLINEQRETIQAADNADNANKVQKPTLKSKPEPKSNVKLKPSLRPSFIVVMKEKQLLIYKIKNILNEETKPIALFASLSAALDNLRDLYKSNKFIFSNSDIDFLKWASEINYLLMLVINKKKKLEQQILKFREQY
jgi:hypothetical protein